VPEDQLSLAIGKDGRNVRLAANLTGWKIDIKTTETPIEETEDGAKESESDEKPKKVKKSKKTSEKSEEKISDEEKSEQ
jgi:N utilization substance protein A